MFFGRGGRRRRPLSRISPGKSRSRFIPPGTICTTPGGTRHSTQVRHARPGPASVSETRQVFVPAPAVCGEQLCDRVGVSSDTWGAAGHSRRGRCVTGRHFSCRAAGSLCPAVRNACTAAGHRATCLQPQPAAGPRPADSRSSVPPGSLQSPEVSVLTWTCTDVFSDILGHNGLLQRLLTKKFCMKKHNWSKLYQFLFMCYEENVMSMR